MNILNSYCKLTLLFLETAISYITVTHRTQTQYHVHNRNVIRLVQKHYHPKTSTLQFLRARHSRKNLKKKLKRRQIIPVKILVSIMEKRRAKNNSKFLHIIVKIIKHLYPIIITV